jgi:hypothetical protein
MFQESAKLHFLCKCNVGGGSPDVKGRLFGMGCLLDNYHVLTAWHVWGGIQQEYAWPVVLKYDGLYKCQIVFEQQDADLLIIKTTEKITDCELNRPSRYPQLSANTPFLGKTVGSIALLNTQEVDGEKSYTYFSMSCLSMFMGGTQGKACHIAMTGSLIQKGFSGGPVFEENGDIVGVLIQSFRFSLDRSTPDLSIATLPIMSTIFPYREEMANSMR